MARPKRDFTQLSVLMSRLQKRHLCLFAEKLKKWFQLKNPPYYCYGRHDTNKMEISRMGVLYNVEGCELCFVVYLEL